MSCALPCTWWCCTLEPVWAPPRKLRTKSLSYVCSGLFCKPNLLFCFELWYSSCYNVECSFHTFPKWCSHISMGVLILLDHWDCHVNSFPTGVLLFMWIRSFSTSARSILSFLNGVCFIHSKLPLFSRPPTLFLQGLRFLNHVFFYLWEVSSFFSFNVLIRWFSMNMLTKLQVHHSSFLYSSPVD